MPLIQFELPQELDKQLRLFMVENDYVSKSETIIKILENKLMSDIKEGD